LAETLGGFFVGRYVMTRFANGLVAMLMLAFIPVYAAAGPFGIEQGMKKEQLKDLKETKPFQFSISPPKPHPRFELYNVKIHPKTGVCFLLAAGVTISTSVYGTELKGEFEEIRGQLSKIYGNSDTYDQLSYGSIWNEPKDWMMALRKKERGLQASWNNKSNAKMKDGITEILLSTIAPRTDKGYLVLQYEFSNTEKCRELIKKEAAKTF
jgi:hypothetical protein